MPRIRTLFMGSPASATVAVPRADPRASDAYHLWQRVLSRLRLTTGEAHFDTYLGGTRGLSYDAGASVIRVAVANPFHVPWLEGKFSSAIHTAVAEIVGGPVRVEFCPADRVAPDGQPRPARPAPLLAQLEVAAERSVHVRRLRRGPVQSIGSRGLAGRGRSSWQRVQPAVPVRWGRTGENAPAARDWSCRRGQWCRRD